MSTAAEKLEAIPVASPSVHSAWLSRKSDEYKARRRETLDRLDHRGKAFFLNIESRIAMVDGEDREREVWGYLEELLTPNGTKEVAQ